MSDVMRKEQKELTDKQKQLMVKVKEIGEEFYNCIESMLEYPGIAPGCQELSLAKVKIQEAVMWAVKGITA